MLNAAKFTVQALREEHKGGRVNFLPFCYFPHQAQVRCGGTWRSTKLHTRERKQNYTNLASPRAFISSYDTTQISKAGPICLA